MKRFLVTITDNIAPTSMPYNEFVLYRRKHEMDEKQIVILLFRTNTNETIPEDIEFHCVGKDRTKLRRIVEEVVARAAKEQATVVFHIHEAKSVLLFNVATEWKYRRQIVYTLHSTYKNYPFHNKLFAQFASRQCGQVICVSETSYKYYPKALKQKLGGRVGYIQNGVDVERIDSALADRKKNGVFTFIYVARLVELKRHKILLNALRMVPGVKLKLIGYGPLEQELRKEAEGLNVEFLGAQPRNSVYEELKKSDAYISSSSYEGLPIGVLEAMCCGLPCILSDIEQHREIAEKCRGVILCKDDMWENALKNLKEMNREDLLTVGKQNASDVKKSFSLAAMHRKYDEIYSKLER